MIKLLDKPFKAFTLYALVILLLSIPVYVLVVDSIWVKELDEHNLLTLQHTKNRLESKALTENDIVIINNIWGELQPGVSIEKSDQKHIVNDSIYEVTRVNRMESKYEEDRFRGLKSFIRLNNDVYKIQIETNVEELDETLISISVITCLFFILLIVGFIFLNKNIAQKSWKPFYETLKSLKSFDLSKDNMINLPETHIEEFHQLNESISLLVEKNIKSYQLQKSFTENASHELQTPIALLKSKMDLLLQEKSISPQVSEILKAIEIPLSRLTRINKNLLLLAKVEHQQFEEEAELDIRNFVESSVILFEDYIFDKKININCIFDNSLLVTANSFLVETLINNLLSNAIKHNLCAGEILIKLEERRLTFSNLGNERLNEYHLFERFSSLATKKVSSGLGLAIIKEICNRYSWIIEYKYDGNKHIFTVDF